MRRRGLPSVYDVTATVFPSGDHAGSARLEPSERRDICFPVCASNNSRSEYPSPASATTATRFPSGDGAGLSNHVTSWNPLAAFTSPLTRLLSAPPVVSLRTTFEHR